jgi:hypothetical protein
VWVVVASVRTSAAREEARIVLALTTLLTIVSLPRPINLIVAREPTFVDDPRETRARRRLAAVVSDGGVDCAKDARVRIDTAAVQEWITRVIREELGNSRPARGK